MSKARLEAFSDCMFSIVMTLLILDITVPNISGIHTNAELWQQLLLLWPLVATYFVSFVILSTFWINHHFIFASMAKDVDRNLNLINLAYLMFVAFVPFSAHLLGNFEGLQPASIIFGVNIFLIVVLSRVMTNYILKHKELRESDLSQRSLKQGRLRGTISLLCYLVGIACSFFYLPLTIFFYAFPIVFNIIPGTVNLAEKIFKFSLD